MMGEVEVMAPVGLAKVVAASTAGHGDAVGAVGMV